MPRWLADEDAPLAAVRDAVLAWVPYAADSPLYTLLATRIADDPEMLRVVARIRSVPPLNVLFGAAQLLVEPDDAVAAWYPRLAGEARAPDDDGYAAFRGFVLARRERILAESAGRRTQTNEVRRCAVLMPVAAAALKEYGWDGPVHAIDVGASAGLGLCLDAVRYRYGDVTVGDGPLTLEAEIRGGVPVPREVPPLATRTGLDLAPVDVDDPDAVAWLEALVWPEQPERLARLRAAVELRRTLAVRMVAGDAVETLPAVASSLPPGPAVIWHAVAMYQLDDAQQDALDDAVAAVAAARPTVRVAYEPQPTGGVDVRVALRPRDARPVAIAHAHGAWIDAP